MTVNPPMIDEATGERYGDPIVYQTTPFVEDEIISDDDIHPDAISQEHAQRIAQESLIIFNENATDQEIRNFWLSNEPLTDSQIDAIQSAYVASDNEILADLLMFRLGLKEAGELPDHIRDELFGSDDFTGDGTSEEQAEVLTTSEVDHMIHNNATEPDQATAMAVLEADIGDSEAAAAVQHLASQYYAGNITAQDAYQEALDSGIPQEALYAAFNQLYNQLTQ